MEVDFLYKARMVVDMRVYKASRSITKGSAAKLDFMDEAGPLERQTFQWADWRANLVCCYEWSAQCDNVIAKDYNNIDNTLFEQLKALHDRVYKEAMYAYEHGKPCPDYYADPEFLQIRADYYTENGIVFKFTV